MNENLKIWQINHRNEHKDLTWFSTICTYIHLGLHKKARARDLARTQLGLELIWLELK
jgi:hypothetical protein